MNATVDAIEARGRAPSPDVIEQEKQEQMKALARVRKMVAWPGSGSPTPGDQPSQSPGWARGLWPETSRR